MSHDRDSHHAESFRLIPVVVAVEQSWGMLTSDVVIVKSCSTLLTSEDFSVVLIFSWMAAQSHLLSSRLMLKILRWLETMSSKNRDPHSSVSKEHDIRHDSWDSLSFAQYHQTCLVFFMRSIFYAQLGESLS